MRVKIIKGTSKGKVKEYMNIIAEKLIQKGFAVKDKSDNLKRNKKKEGKI